MLVLNLVKVPRSQTCMVFSVGASLGYCIYLANVSELHHLQIFHETKYDFYNFFGVYQCVDY